MRKIVIGGIAVAMGISTAAATGAFAGGNGADRSGLSSTNGGGTTGSNCERGSGTAVNGFVMLNAPGKPNDPRKLIGEVSVKHATANTTYTVYVAKDDGNKSCMNEGMLTTNGQGNGNAHIADLTLGAGSFYVVLKAGAAEALASGTVGPLT